MSETGADATDSPKISVIVPVYNSRHYLRQCLNSILEQSLREIEVICVNDGSTDGSLDILEEYSKKDCRVITLNQENMGAGAARNYGVSHARGEYVHFMDSDDWLAPHAYEILYEKVRGNDVDVCIFQRIKYNNETGATTIDRRCLQSADEISNFWENSIFFTHSPVVPWNKITRLSLIKDRQLKYDEIVCVNDRSFYFELMLFAKNVMVCHEELIYYRVNNNESLIGVTRSKNFDCHFIALESTMSRCSNLDEKRRAMVIDTAMTDILLFYNKSGKKYKKDIHKQLHEYFKKLDLSCFGDTLPKYNWYREYKNIKDNEKMVLPPRDIRQIGGALLYRMRTELNKMLHKEWAPKVKEIGVTEEKRNPKVIVSLTSYPARINVVHITIESILSQAMKPDMVILWLAAEQFEGGEDSLPHELRRLTKYGLTIRWCDDLKPHKKYYYTMKEYSDDIVITVDDDVIYPKELVKKLYESYQKHPHAVSATRVHRIETDEDGLLPYSNWTLNYRTMDEPSMALIATGVGGVLYPPHCLHPELFNKEAIMETCLNADDLWLKTMGILNGTPTVLANFEHKIKQIDGTEETALWLDNKLSGGNDRQLSNILNKYNSELESINFIGKIEGTVDQDHFALSRPTMSVVLTVLNELDDEDCEMLSNRSDDEKIEFIAVCADNCENTVNLLSSMSNKDPRITTVSVDIDNKYELRNIGLRMSRGKYVSFINDPSDLERQIELFKEISETDAPFLFSDPCDEWDLPLAYYASKYHEVHLNKKYDPVHGIYRRKFLLKNHITFSDVDLISDTAFSNSVLYLADVASHRDTKPPEDRRDYKTIIESLVSENIDHRSKHDIFTALRSCSDDDSLQMIEQLESDIESTKALSDAAEILHESVINNVCPICHKGLVSFDPFFGTNMRDNALCPNCESLERHRLCWTYLTHYTDIFDKECNVLQAAPSECLMGGFMKSKNVHYNRIGVVADPISNLNDGVFKYIICNNILQRVKDEEGFLSEMFRVLAPDGIAIISSYINMKNEKTIEDRNATSTFRTYGKDFIQRLSGYNISVTETKARDIFAKEKIKTLGLSNDEFLFICKKTPNSNIIYKITI